MKVKHLYPRGGLVVLLSHNKSLISCVGVVDDAEIYCQVGDIKSTVAVGRTSISAKWVSL